MSKFSCIVDTPRIVPGIVSLSQKNPIACKLPVEISEVTDKQVQLHTGAFYFDATALRELAELANAMADILEPQPKDEWIPWDAPQPINGLVIYPNGLKPDTLVHYKLRDGRIIRYKTLVRHLTWHERGDIYTITAYKLV